MTRKDWFPGWGPDVLKLIDAMRTLNWTGDSKRLFAELRKAECKAEDKVLAKGVVKVVESNARGHYLRLTIACAALLLEAEGQG